MIKTLKLFAAAGTLFSLACGCQTQMGVGLSPAQGLDLSRGTFYTAPDIAETFNYEMLAAPAVTRAYKITVPFTFGLLSCGWGNVDMHNLMVKNRMEKIEYADYERFCFLGVVEYYKILAYGPRKPQPLL